jgi:hypothetical protein
MRSPGVIYRKYRQIKRKYLYEALVSSREKKHDNCVYGRSISYTDCLGNPKEVLVCSYGCLSKSGEALASIAGPGTDLMNEVYGLDVCTCPRDCSAFASKWNREEVIRRFEGIVKNQALRSKCFPELEAYEWVLDKQLTDTANSPSYIGKVIIYLIKVLEDALKLVGKNKQ